jgi:hypothetical protein
MGNWVIGALINIVGSVAINFGTNLLKLGHDQVYIARLLIELLVLNLLDIYVCPSSKLRVLHIWLPGFNLLGQLRVETPLV